MVSKWARAPEDGRGKVGNTLAVLHVLKSSIGYNTVNDYHQPEHTLVRHYASM